MFEMPKGPVLVKGTGGNLDYIAIAHRGPVVLAIKDYGMVSGELKGMPGHVSFETRLRACYAPDELKQAGFSWKPIANEGAPGSVWPDIVWEKEKESYASTSIALLEKGHFQNVDGCKPLITKMESGEIAKKLVDYVVKLAGNGAMLMTEDALRQVLQIRFYEPIVEKLKPKLKQVSAFNEAMSDSVGTFAMQAEIIKKAQQKGNFDGEPQHDDTSGDA